ncbi:MAG: thiol peroxidase [Nitrospirota bacterium]
MVRSGIITSHGRPLTLLGHDLGVGASAPDFTVLNGDAQEVRLSDHAGKIKVISVTPSLDTPVCDLQLRRFNSEAVNLPAGIVIMNISMDLPFAVSRICTAAGIDRVLALSDHRDASFGVAFGVLIRELRLLARAIFILDRENVVRYREIVQDLSSHPDYEKALQALQTLLTTAQAA